MVVTHLAFIKYVDEVQACDSSGCGLEWSLPCCASSFPLTLTFVRLCGLCQSFVDGEGLVMVFWSIFLGV